uniref:Putative site-specific DNA endonuclease n=1 Tax=Tupiella akineta TaxID=160070 RepID=Q6UVS2_TUPAK|nr:putative site-specific DNA endonuclease [Tupiella akineta]AAQ18752.1 putative site-specific DNA endonuclease [Tupiella akineta]
MAIQKNTKKLITNKPANITTSTSNKMSYPFIAGLIDGDGHIVVFKNTGEYVITMHIEDELFLNELQQQFGGYLKKVANKKAMRFHLNAKTAINGKDTLVELTKGLNGHIRNTIRVEQFKKICTALSIIFIEPEPLTGKDGYIAGLFTADGTAFLNCRLSAAAKKEKSLNSVICKQLSDELSPLEIKIQRILKGVAPFIEIRIANQLLDNVGDISKALGLGTTSFSKGDLRAPKGHFYFFIKKEIEIVQFYEYINLYRTLSVKYKRLDLMEQFFMLRENRAHLAKENSIKAKEWETFVRKWYWDNFLV